MLRLSKPDRYLARCRRYSLRWRRMASRQCCNRPPPVGAVLDAFCFCKKLLDSGRLSGLLIGIFGEFQTFHRCLCGFDSYVQRLVFAARQVDGLRQDVHVFS